MNDMNHPFKGFDESTYLKLNPDVSEAVKNGSFSSGLAHYICHGFNENRLGVSPEVRKAIKCIVSDRRPSLENTKQLENSLLKCSLKKPAKPIPPESMSYVGDGDFEKIGQKFKRYFIELASLQPNDRVLDVGCGTGRMAIPLTDYLSRKGEYWGFDIVKKGIEWCQNQVSTRFSNFHFQHVNIYNKSYNSGGKIQAKDLQFPFQKDYFDFIFLTSVFTHMLPLDTENYISEMSRVLRPGGKCLITFFLLNDESENLIHTRQSTLDFKYNLEGCLTVDKNSPERAIAYNEDYVKGLFENAGLKIHQPIHYGSWCKRDVFSGYQDMLVATKGH